jgi:hypothetical protein
MVIVKQLLFYKILILLCAAKHPKEVSFLSREVPLTTRSDLPIIAVLRGRSYTRLRLKNQSRFLNIMAKK